VTERALVVCLAGPTGTGKTELALRLAAHYALDIVSVDSAMVYRHMDIGTAKPAPGMRAAIPHHLIDVLDPWETYSAGQFRADALRLIPDIHARGRVPLLVGGTMLYFRALFRGLAPLPGADPEVRAALDAEAAARGWAALHGELARVDPAAAARIPATDRQRIQRALEVFRLTGRPISELQESGSERADLRFLRIVLSAHDRRTLRERLDRRLRAMLEAGFLEEVRRLMAMPQMSRERAAMRAVGYRQLWRHLAGELDFEEAVRQAAVATHRLAKRQLTWLRAEPRDLTVDAAAVSGPGQLAAALEAAGVSRRDVRCNIMGPLERREHGV
jgi:tRNA dimethylallyltransferase